MELRERPLNSGSRGTVVEVSGRLDQRVTPELKERLEGTLDHERRLIIVDLTKVDFLDSAALAVLISARREADTRKVDMVLVAPNGPAKQIFSLTRCDEYFKLFDSVEAALAASQGVSR